MEKRKYQTSFVNFNKLTVSKDNKKIIVHMGNALISLNINYLKAIIKNLENPVQDTDGFLPSETKSEEAS